MITVEVQIHGYRKGHQLLASSIVLTKEDQAVVDRLSDVAGPLRPREQFEPYLSAYPLPSGIFYVVARTWQDLSVARAGCVRTKSVLIDARMWCQRPPLIPVLTLLDSVEIPTESEATRTELRALLHEHLPPAPNFGASELLEALFLEDAKPVVVFDAPDPELISLRLLASLWPDIRQRFSLSTFALSPRKIGGRDLDLVFAPTNAKAKFSDWPGRRVDGRSSPNDRHRWTETIVRRVFEASVPRLLSDDEIDFLGDRNADGAAPLRVALLWDELLSKVDRMPTAVLGLLDIANSGMVKNSKAMKSLEPRLVQATRLVAVRLPPTDAWDFVGAIARKMQGYDMPNGREAVEQLASDLARRAPDGAFSLLRQPDPKGAIDDLVPSIAIGLGSGAATLVEHALAHAPMGIVARLVSQGGDLARRVAENHALVEKIGQGLPEVAPDLADRAGTMLLPYLLEDQQITAAIPIFAKLDSRGVAEKLGCLGDANDFRAEQLSALLIKRAYEVGGILAIRDVLLLSRTSARRDALLGTTIKPIQADVLWLLNEDRLSKTTAAQLLVSVLRNADEKQFAVLLSDKIVGERVAKGLPNTAADILVKEAHQDIFPMHAFIRAIQFVLPIVDNAKQFDIAGRVLGRCLRNPLDDDEIEVLPMLFGILGERINAGWVARTGVERGIDANVASRNLVAFDKAPASARTRMVGAVDEIARALHERRTFDLTEWANDAYARLMFDAEKGSRKPLLDAAGWLVPSLLRSGHHPVSLMVAAMFPIVYRELAKESDISDLLKLIPFVHWDRSKTARQELINAFMSSSWKAGDFALTAIRCGDARKFLKEVAWSYGGQSYLKQIENDLGRLDMESQRLIKREIAEIRSGR